MSLEQRPLPIAAQGSFDLNPTEPNLHKSRSQMHARGCDLSVKACRTVSTGYLIHHSSLGLRRNKIHGSIIFVNASEHGVLTWLSLQVWAYSGMSDPS